MKLLVFVATFIFYLYSKTTALTCYTCNDQLPIFGYLACNDSSASRCYPPFSESDFCFTQFALSNENVDYLDCGKEYCMHKSCNHATNVEGDEYMCTSAGLYETRKYWIICCKRDFCNELDAGELLKQQNSNEAESLNQKHLISASILCILSSLTFLA